MIIPEIMGIVVDFYHQKSVLLQINDDPNYCTIDQARDLSLDKMHVKIVSNRADEGYPFVMADIEPVMSGVRCWRMRVQRLRRHLIQIIPIITDCALFILFRLSPIVSLCAGEFLKLGNILVMKKTIRCL